MISVTIRQSIGLDLPMRAIPKVIHQFSKHYNYINTDERRGGGRGLGLAINNNGIGIKGYHILLLLGQKNSGRRRHDKDVFLSSFVEYAVVSMRFRKMNS